ncbi:MAG TPA: cytochrome c [Saprospiraceae bacterium]|nr:cytochrome c [Saprospiraceae bacterium]HMQ85625.1 cytochrome c [Saprospiraceae bacterium]
MRSFLIIPIAAMVLFFTSCGGSEQNANANQAPPKSMVADEQPDDGKGVGEIKEVTLNDPLKSDMVEKGKAIYEMKCSACHKLTDQRVVGPGWAGLTKKRKPEWVMNMITNVEVMLEQDPTAQKLLEECLTRMPNQNMSTGDARDVLEFIYANDGYAVE